ncbi:MAG: FAM210A/B-like domain-containing protein [Myxococcota bacterium]
MKAKLKNLMELYGRLGVGIYVALCLVTFGGAFVLLRAGLQDMLPPALLAYLPAEGTTFLGAYAIYKGLQLPRIALALAITPIVARWLGRAPEAAREAA